MPHSKIEISCHIAAPLPTVWTCYTSPEHITKWNFASDDWHCPSAFSDLAEGGRYVARMEAKDGSFGFDLETILKQFSPPDLLEMELMDGRSALTRFESVDGYTHVVTVFDPETQNPEDMQKQGWQAILNNFKTYVESIS